jgi:hypothetical protein
MDDEQRGGRTEPPAREANEAAAPGSSGPGEQGYDGAATVGDEGAGAGPEAYQDPFGRDDDGGRDGDRDDPPD